ncbi:MAG TPA: SufD family Fe-S cluster assembly protein [Rhizomicrobium sp.]|nr:SufD family Fe-S cluster assembly protein [Rhizomicrobium sp.]
MTLPLDLRRDEAAEALRERGVPHRRVEAWKYSDLRSVIGAEQIKAAGAAKWELETRSGEVELFDLAGERAPDWAKRYIGASPGGVMGMASLAYARTGFALRVRKAAAVSVVFPTAGQARVLIVLEDGATLDYREAARGDGFQNIGVDVVIGKDAHFTHARLAAATPGVRIEDVAASVAARGSYRLHTANFGAQLSRLELQIALTGEAASAHLSGVSVLGGAAHADVTTHIDHAVGNTASTQLFKHVVGGKGRAVYQGKITVREGANGSDSRQTAKALLLDERAEADLKPELEIFADDVKCAHGAAVGDLDADSLFYLRARGIPEAEARRLLMRAFLEEALMGVENDETRAWLWSAVEEAL